MKDNYKKVLSCESCEIFKNTFFTAHLQATASGNSREGRVREFFLSEVSGLD